MMLYFKCVKCGKDIKGASYVNMQLVKKLGFQRMNGVHFCKNCDKEERDLQIDYEAKYNASQDKLKEAFEVINNAYKYMCEGRIKSVEDTLWEFIDINRSLYEKLQEEKNA